MGFISNRLDAWRRSVGIKKLFIAEWRGSIAAILLALIALFFVFGFWWPYWRVADMDTFMVYESFLLNDGLRQENFYHPGYLTILLLGEWFKVLHAVNALPVHALSELPPVMDVSASTLAWMRATQAARILSLIIGLAFVTSFAYLMRQFLRDWRVATLSAFMLAFSGGFMMESRIVRTELIAVGFAYSSLLILLIAAGRVKYGARPLLIAVASLLATLAMLNKVQIILLLGAIPPIVFVFGREVDDLRSVWRRRGAMATAILFVAVAALAIALAWPIVQAGLSDPESVAQRIRIFGSAFPIYQTLFGIWVAAWIATYAVRFRVNALETLSAFAAVVAGTALGLLALGLRYDVQNAVAVMNPIECMLTFAAYSHPELLHSGTFSGGGAVHLITDGIGLVFARQTFFLSPSSRPTIFLGWVVIAAVVFAWRRGERKTIFQVVALIAAAWAIDLIGTLRGLKLEYSAITDPLVIIAAAWLLIQVPDLQYHRWAHRIGLSLMTATICVGLSPLVKHTFTRKIPLDFCVPHFEYTKRIERFSYCPTAMREIFDRPEAHKAVGLRNRDFRNDLPSRV